MPIKKSAILLPALAISSVSLLLYSEHQSGLQIVPALKVPPVKCCQTLKENELFSPWGIMSQSMFRIKA